MHGVLVLQFFGSSCDEECRSAMQEVEDEYTGFESYGLLVVGVDAVFDPTQTAENERDWSVFLRGAGETVPTVMAARPALLRLGIADVPTTVIVDRQGVVRYVHVGASKETAAEVEGLLDPRVRASADADGNGEGASDGAESGQGIGLANLGRIQHTPGQVNHARVRSGNVRATGALPVEVIERIVRQNFARYRLCYEDGLSKNRKLSGQISVHFKIDEDGTIGTKPTATTSRFGDGRVVDCVLNAMRNLSFPQPDSGVVNVVFELILLPPEEPVHGSVPRNWP